MDQPIRESGPHLAELLAGGLRGEGPLYRQLSEALKRAIDRGEIALGTVLPPERSLARSLAVSRATVVAAYDRLKSDGWLDSRQGSGTWVRRPEGNGSDAVDAVATGRLFLSEDRTDQLTGPGEHPLGDEDVVELSVAAVTGNRLVTELLASLDVNDVASLTGHHGYVPHGLRALREQLAARFRADSVPTTEDQIVVTTGAHQAISLVARQTLQHGDPVLVESPTFPGALDVFRRFGARPIPLPLDEHGARTDVLPDLVERLQPRLIYISPTYHNPTGTVLPEDRRRVLADLALRTGVVILEDLAQADVQLDEAPVPPPIASFAPAANIHSIGSTAKLYWAGLRVGWLRSPDSWAARMLATKTVADLGTPLISQLLARRLLEHADEVAASRRRELIPCRDLLVRLLHQQLPDWRFAVPAGGLCLWVQLPRGNAEEFTEVALRFGVAIVPGPALSVDEGNRQAVRLVFSRRPELLEEGVRRLATAWEAYAPASARSVSRLLV